MVSSIKGATQQEDFSVNLFCSKLKQYILLYEVPEAHIANQHNDFIFSVAGYIYKVYWDYYM